MLPRPTFTLSKTLIMLAPINKGHGRIEIRECWLMRDTPVIAEFREQQGWTELHTLIKIRRQREIDGRRTDEVSG